MNSFWYNLNIIFVLLITDLCCQVSSDTMYPCTLNIHKTSSDHENMHLSLSSLWNLRFWVSWTNNCTILSLYHIIVKEKSIYSHIPPTLSHRKYNTFKNTWTWTQVHFKVLDPTLVSTRIGCSIFVFFTDLAAH